MSLIRRRSGLRRDLRYRAVAWLCEVRTAVWAAWRMLTGKLGPYSGPGAGHVIPILECGST
eukprot:3822401-Lingulodinium_polyedra.AAC.1